VIALTITAISTAAARRRAKNMGVRAGQSDRARYPAAWDSVPAVDPARAADLRNEWVARHQPEERPSPAALDGVERMLARLPDVEAAAAITDSNGRRQIAVLAGGAVYLVWVVPGGAGTAEAARCRRIPLAPADVELSERVENGVPVRHWWFQLSAEPLVFRALDARDAAFADALAAALGWPSLG
jgi:hypothetical protein